MQNNSIITLIQFTIKAFNARKLFSHTYLTDCWQVFVYYLERTVADDELRQVGHVSTMEQNCQFI